MKVKQLIALLQIMDPEKMVLIGPDREDWFYDVFDVDVAEGRIVDGKMTDENDPNPVVLINMVN